MRDAYPNGAARVEVVATSKSGGIAREEGHREASLLVVSRRYSVPEMKAQKDCIARRKTAKRKYSTAGAGRRDDGSA